MKRSLRKIIQLFIIAGFFCLTLAGCSVKQVIQDKTGITIGDTADKDDKNTGNSGNTQNKEAYDPALLSSEYLVGYDYFTGDFLEYAPTVIFKVRYDGRIEASFEHKLSNGEIYSDTAYFDMTQEQFDAVKTGIDLKKLYELDPEESDPKDVCDGDSSYLIIYRNDGSVYKTCGGFCPTNKDFNDMRRVVYMNIPEAFKEYCDHYKEAWVREENFTPYYGDPGNSYISTSYGVFLDYEGDLEELSDYDYLVIDASYFDDKQIRRVNGYNRYVYSYLNVGSLEDFRDYYDEFSDLTLGDYENWEGEKWIDVSDKRWQDFILNELAPGLLAKGITGFFVDNLDVYYEYPTEEIFDGLTVILKGLKSFGCDVIINGGDTFLDAYTEKGGDFREIITGINQECVFTGIDWENDRLIQSSGEDKEYFTDYIEKYADRGAYIFMIEYAKDDEENSQLRQDIRYYAEKNGFLYYIADSTALQAEREGENMKEAATLLYQGHASMRITTPEGKTIYVDPFMGTGYDVPADLILETHGHYDHTQTDLIKTKNDDCITITWKEGIKGGEHQSFDLGYVKVEAVEAGYNKNHDAKECVGFILTFSNGVTLYLSGDTSTTPQMEELADRELDYAFFCCDGVYNMAMPEAIECAKTVGAKHSIPYHMIPANNSEGFDQSVAEQFEVPGSMIVRPGEELVLE